MYTNDTTDLIGAPTGVSRCKEGKKCVAMVMLSSLMRDDLSKVGTACPEFGIDNKGTCEFLCGTFANSMYHTSKFIRAPLEGYDIDFVVMHDQTMPKSAMAAINHFGARTLPIPDIVKRIACLGYIKANPEKKSPKLNEETCMKNPFDNHFKAGDREMFYLQLKLAAMTMDGYDAIVHIDQDLFLSKPDKLKEELDFFFQKPDIGLMARIGRWSPLNAAHWIAEPSKEIASIWISDLANGFTVKNGWMNAGKVVPRVRNGHISPQDWDFIGANGDQGLLYHVFSTVLKSYYPQGEVAKDILRKKSDFEGNTMMLMEDNVEDFGIAFNHFTGSSKPWNAKICRKNWKCDRRAELTKLLEYMGPTMTAFPTSHISPFLRDFCLPMIRQNEVECSNSLRDRCPYHANHLHDLV